MGSSSDDLLVTDTKSMSACVLRMHLSNDAVVFWNHNEQFRIMMRTMAEDPDNVTFDIGMCLFDEDDDGLTPMGRDINTALGNEWDGYVDESVFVLEEFSFALEDLEQDHGILKTARDRLNALWRYSLCHCESYFIKDQASMCLHCQLTEKSAPSRHHFCAICHETSPERFMVRQKCCDQHLHRSCLSTWESTSRDRTCPLCRTKAQSPHGATRTARADHM